MQVSQRNMKGFTFLELLIALAIFSAGLLGVLQLQFLAQRQLYEAVYVSRAVQQAYNLSALLMMFDAQPNSARARQLQEDWNLMNAQLLPEGAGNLEHSKITVFWKNPLSVEAMFVQMGYEITP
ncbi:MAG: prepilin-type N-terminal cleavage/methylation domain-containing protein [Legionellales bacterium]